MNFFACKTDLLNIFKFILSETDLRIYEHYSEYDKDLREFSSVEEILEAFNLGVGDLSTHLMLYSPSLKGKLVTRKIIFNSDVQEKKGHTYRYEIAGWGMIQMELEGIHQKSIIASYINCNSQKRARWEDNFSKVRSADAWDWKAVTSIFRKLSYYIRKMAIDKAFWLKYPGIPGIPVLPEAYQRYKEGYLLKDIKDAKFSYSLK